MAACEALLHIGSQVIPEYSSRAGAFYMWGCGAVFALDVCSIALGHLSELKRRRDLWCSCSGRLGSSYSIQFSS